MRDCDLDPPDDYWGPDDDESDPDSPNEPNDDGCEPICHPLWPYDGVRVL